MSLLQEHVLVLNKHWTPITTCTVERAFRKVFSSTGRFLDIETYLLHDFESWVQVSAGKDHIITSSISIRLPEILVLKSPITANRKVMQFARKNILKRDHHICQYCGIKLKENEATIDHIFPRTKGGKTNWLNCVMSCLPCNSYKADKLPHEAGMQLKVREDIKSLYPHNEERWRQPYEPAWSPTYKVPTTKIRESWKGFLNEKNISIG